MKTVWINRTLDLCLFWSFALLAGSGLVMEYPLAWERNLPAGTTLLGLDRHGWALLHLLSGFVVIFLILTHVALHWRWIWSAAARRLPAPVALAGAVGLLLAALPLAIAPKLPAPPAVDGAQETAAPARPPARAAAVLLCYSAGEATFAPGLDGETVALMAGESLRRRGLRADVADLAHRQPGVAELAAADAVIFVAPVHFGGVHWPVKKLIDDRNGALYYSPGSAGRIRRALCLLLVEDRRKLGGALGDFNAAGSPFPGGENRIDEILEPADPATVRLRVDDAVARLVAILGAGQ